jgi:pSer/pThr/pTyr-binding forkhead associated (FHA) protein
MSSLSYKATFPAVLLRVAETGKEIPLFKPVTVFGRSSDCDIILRVSDVSKRHCLIRLKSKQALVEDLASSNGTRVNGSAVEHSPLHDGDELDIAGHVFWVTIPKSK